MSSETAPETPLRVLLVDDQQLVRSGFAMILSGEADLEVVGEAADGAAALDAARRLRPEVVLMDVQMPVMDGIEATRRIVAEELAKVVILTTFDRDDYVFAGLQAGASGFLLKNADPAQLLDAVRAVGHGYALLAPEVTRRVIERWKLPSRHTNGAATLTPNPATAAPWEGRDGAPGRAHGRALALLTEREREVLVLVARGLSNAEIAERLVVGDATVKTHVSNLLAKLHLRDRVQAVVFAYEAGLILAGE